MRASRLSAAPITLTTEEDQDLRRLSRAHKTPRKLAERATIIVLAAAGAGVRETARQNGLALSAIVPPAITVTSAPSPKK